MNRILNQLSKNKGSASQFALISILAVIIISTGLFILLGGMQRITMREKINVETASAFQEALYIATGDITENEEPEADSYYDLYAKDYSYYDEDDVLSKTVDGIKISIREHSGRLSLNMMHANLIKNTSLKSLFKAGTSDYKFRDFQAELGFTENLDDYRELFNAEADMRHFTVYGYGNFNISSDNALIMLGTIRCDNEASGQSIKSISDQFRSQVKLASKTDFNTRVYLKYPETYPMLNLEPVLNINFATEKIIRALCSYPYGEHKIPNGQAIAENIISIRNSREIKPDELEKLIPTQKEFPTQQRIFQYFGTVTWFWEIILENGTNTASALLVRVPEHDSDKYHYRLAEYRIQ
jgi:hypothetical protein